MQWSRKSTERLTYLPILPKHKVAGRRLAPLPRSEGADERALGVREEGVGQGFLRGWVRIVSGFRIR